MEDTPVAVVEEVRERIVHVHDPCEECAARAVAAKAELQHKKQQDLQLLAGLERAFESRLSSLLTADERIQVCAAFACTVELHRKLVSEK